MLVLQAGFPAAKVEFTEHAVDRFRERARPGLDFENALGQLESMGCGAVISVAPPAWMANARRDADAYLVLADVAFPLARSTTRPGRYHATTCIPKGGISPTERDRRRTRKRRRLQRRR